MHRRPPPTSPAAWCPPHETTTARNRVLVHDDAQASPADPCIMHQHRQPTLPCPPSLSHSPFVCCVELASSAGGVAGSRPSQKKQPRKYGGMRRRCRGRRRGGGGAPRWRYDHVFMMATGRCATETRPHLGKRRRKLVKRWGSVGVALVAWTNIKAGAHQSPYQRREGENHLSFNWFSPSLAGPLVASFLLHPPRLVLLTLRLAAPRGLVALPPGFTVGGAGG